jgi:hypothetical protein
MNGGAVILFLPPGAEEDAKFVAIRVLQSDLIREYYCGDIPTIIPKDFAL